MSISSIPERTRMLLWGKAAGRCEYEGCNRPLWLDSVTNAECNIAYIAHIIADSPGGPRGDPALSPKLKADIANLMLMCDEHHRLIDKEDIAGHTVDRLLAMKSAHETRIEIVTGIAPDKASHVLLYGANVGAQSSPLTFPDAMRAMVPDYYPADRSPIVLSLINSSFEDRDTNFWEVESGQLRKLIAEKVRPRLQIGEVSHLSVFAFAPQPLLILLGSLLSDIPAAEVYQLQREPRGWKWEDESDAPDFLISDPTKTDGNPALVFSLSATVSDQRIFSVLGDGASIWRVTIENPHNDFLKSKRQSQIFRKKLRPLMDRIKSRHGEKAVIHVFPAMPVALAVEFGRILMPKADLPLAIYDENRGTGGFVRALDINMNEVR